MSKIKNTPGPWSFSPSGTIVTATVTREINGRMRTYEQKIATTPSGLDPFERVANARLMAASPDLLEALRLCYDHCRLYHPEVQRNNVGEAVRAAIAKATAQP